MIIEDEFTKDLTAVLNKHKVLLYTSKSGVYIEKNESPITIFIRQADTATEWPYRLLMTVYGERSGV